MCLYEQVPGKMHAPLFQDVQMLSDLRLIPAVGIVVVRIVDGCRESSAHWARVWSTPRHNVQKRVPWPTPWPSMVDACNPGIKVFQRRARSAAACWRNALS